MNCKVCSNPAKFFSKAVILSKYEIVYYICPVCGFIQTEEPYWISEAYSCSSVAEDVGLISRNLNLANISKSIISIFFDKNGTFLDYGGGYGIFARLMRDKGFKFYRYDKYCENIFAINFDIHDDDAAKIELLTAFEVFEHFANPVDELDNLLKYSPNILFTTELIPASLPKPGEWRYYGLNHGQHISFHTLRSLGGIARKQGLNFYTDGNFIHLFSRKKISKNLFRLLCRPTVSALVNRLIPRHSLLEEDYRLISGTH